MDQILAIGGWLLLGMVVGAGIAFLAAVPRFRWWKSHSLISTLIPSHLNVTPLDDIAISERRFPFRVRADFQRAIERLFGENTTVCHFCGVRKEYSHEGIAMSDCLVPSNHNPAVSKRRRGICMIFGGCGM